ncbi:hypothetical protein B0T10DRAFT_485121 [Thelonectria olida]|uniref:Uncharacterized protein n=1 Tax=Thelonectria olida TaxID=1576542 RepID=A0A9P8W6C0_9HYPO|nr:hypothetical protein B0T10DRAFT_485121 [Thelonectria olida]
MAAPPFDPSYVTANPFDIYTDTPVVKTPNPNLPGGHCNFVDLTPGANGAKCGCRRFWSRSSGGTLAPEQNHWCMCNHHACYHEEGDRDAQFPDVQVPGQENEKPRTGREPLSPMIDWTLKTPPAVPGMDFPSFSAPENLSFLNRTPENVNPISRIPASQVTGASLPDTLSWGNLIQSQPQALPLPPIPSQCMMPSQTASTTSSAQAKYLRPFAGKGLQTLSGVTGPKQPTTAPEGSTVPAESFVFVTQDQQSSGTPQASPPSQESRAASTTGISRRAFKNLSETVSGHDQRLDRLETVSFTAPGHEDCQEKHDHADIRITELESRVDEVEKLVNDNQSVVSRRDDASIISVSTSTTSRPTHSQEIYSQVQSLQAQVAHLQSLMPSPSHPWSVEVVFLPFALKKVWQEAHEFKTEPLITSDDWTQLPMTHSTTTMRSQSPLYADWANAADDIKWLLPKAYSDKSIVDQRLRSRGLVKTVTVRGSDARNVAVAMHEAFSNVFREMEIYSRPQSNDARMSAFLGLQSAWVPLRKMHKDSRLRFLSPSEMTTPALWNVQFLSSVVMKSSEPRLFVTHPDAYLQDLQAYDAGWTWQKLKEMNRVDLDTGVPQSGTELDALERSWSWAEVLDEPPAAATSITMPHDRQRTISSSPSQPYFPAVQMIRSSSPSIVRSNSSMLASRRGSRPPHIRTSSMPLAGPSHSSPASARRRVASYGQSRRSSPALYAVPQSAIVKRRRSTRSPSRHRMTPGWTASPSPMPLGLSDRQPVRGTTPFAYATPYSNAPLQEVRGVRGGSVVRVAPEYPSDDDLDFEVDMDESGSDDFYDDEESVGNLEAMAQVEVTAGPESQRWQLPEDEPWPGIEDQDHMSDTENIDPQEGSQGSNVSSQPSEYPSTQSAWPTHDTNAEFEIHEDDFP